MMQPFTTTIDLTTLLATGESETLEFKERWTDSALEALAAFANTTGGILLVGVTDDGRVAGWSGGPRDLQAIANQVVDTARIQPSVTLHPYHDASVLVIQVTRAPWPVACHGRYYRRVGNTVREIPPDELGRFFVSTVGIHGDGIPIDGTAAEIDEEAVRRFAQLARNRLPHLREDETSGSILEKLDLVKGSSLTRAGVLLFGKNPQRSFPTAVIHMGRFRDDITIVDDRLLTGNLFTQLEQVIQLFQRYLQVRYDIGTEGDAPSGLTAFQRREVWEYPLAALREAVINALVHREYFASAMDLQIRVFDERIQITNPGGLPEGLTLAEIQQSVHRSVPRNPLLAQVFYYAELIEKWGTGTTRMIQLCRAQGLPAPEFQADATTFQVIFTKDALTPERLQGIGLSPRQVDAVLLAKRVGRVSNRDMQQLGAVSERTAGRELADLVQRGILERVGRTGKGTVYRLRGATKTPKPPKPPKPPE